MAKKHVLALAGSRLVGSRKVKAPVTIAKPMDKAKPTWRIRAVWASLWSGIRFASLRQWDNIATTRIISIRSARSINRPCALEFGILNAVTPQQRLASANTRMILRRSTPPGEARDGSGAVNNHAPATDST